MADLAEVRDRVKVILGRLEDLTVYRTFPESSPNFPALVMMPALAEFADQRNRLGLDRWDWDLIVMVSFADADVAQQQLDDYLAKDGPRSIRALIRENRTLGLGDGTDAYIAGMEGYGDSYGREQELTNIGAKLRLVVTTNG